MAISWIVTPFSGSPFTNQRAGGPFSHSRSCGAASSIAAATTRARSRTLRATSAVAAPLTGVEREPYVPRPYGVVSVSPWTTSMSSGGIPSSSAVIAPTIAHR